VPGPVPGKGTRLAGLSAALLLLAAAAALAGEPALTVGAYRGRWEKGARLFPAIAYAKPPIGRLRWRAPVREPGERQRGAPVQCPQTLIDTMPNDELETDEDCLYLNVWAPASGERRPVVLFIHGGAYLTGTGLKTFYDGSVFARRGIVFVAINYRLGDLGYGPHFQSEPGSNGLLDQAAALRWVEANIARFGGDPGRIYLMGQSKGAEASAALIESGLAGEHVKGAVAFSGPRHFEPRHNEFFLREPNKFLPGEPFMSWRDFQAERGWMLLTPELPAVRTTSRHRYKVLATGIYREHGGEMYCYDLDFAAHAYDYIDTWFYVLHPGTADHGSELLSLFAEDEYGRRLLALVSAFIADGAPPNPHWFGANRPFRESREALHFYPRFTVAESVSPAFLTGNCPKAMAAGGWRARKLQLLERVAKFLGGGGSQPDFDPLAGR
jgi:hypothetical protein